ncbi:hypothetical protein [Sphingobacterium hungaricum]|uniref:Uncharacterized protein n=1 Tax=Sphingobacterium hungaricum TaxID=2082723 RepID=A0A928UXR4_9SPHI|nr:hypothetical protein [Sphingobacterium hungaricum]MBE8712519.1 hypothetical protein [Sphingobacterium hungaricum]
MKHILILFVFCVLSSISKGQVQQIEDFHHLYSPAPELFLKDFVPPGFVKIEPIQALDVINDYFMERMGETVGTDYLYSYGSYYQKGNVVFSASVYNDSIKWHIKQDILAQLSENPGYTDPNQPISVPDKEEYRNMFKNIDNLDMVQGSMLDLFEFVDRDGGGLWPGLSSDKRTNNTLHIAYAYWNGSEARFKKYAVLFAFDKSFQYKVEFRIYATQAHRQEVEDALKWIATHMEISDNLPE